MWGLDISMEHCIYIYTVGNNCLCAEKEFVVDAVKEAGFSSVHAYAELHVELRIAVPSSTFQRNLEFKATTSFMPKKNSS